jgi:hypothetical protein
MTSKMPMLIRDVRHDLSDWLWHFTRRDQHPFETLKTIVTEERILGSKDKFCEQTAVCLTEMPITEAIRQSLRLGEQMYNRFSDYGVGFRRAWIATIGGLPVIYQPNAMRSDLAPSSVWRHCEMDLQKGIDFSWQREWRVPIAELKFKPSDDVIIVVRTEEEAMEIATKNWAFDYERDEVFYAVIWCYVTHESLKAAKSPADIEILKIVPK